MTKVTRLTLGQSGGLENRRIHLREISGDADAPLETVGQDLRAARLRRGDDLATVSRSLKIRKDHLEALEEDRLEALPGRTYAIGFVRSYADYLGLDSVQCVERFKAEIAGRDNEPAVPAYASGYEESRLPHGWLIIGLVLLAVVVYGAYRLAMSADSLLAPVEPVPTRMMPKAAATAQAVPGTHSAGAQLVPVGAPLQTAPPSTTPAPAGQTAVIPPPGANDGQVVPASPEATAQEQVASLPRGEVFGQQNAGSRVLLRVHAPTKVTVQDSDGTLYLSRTLKPGDAYLVPNRTGLMLTATNGGAVEVQLDGQSLGYVGAAGRSTQDMSLDPQAIVDRLSGGHG